MKPKTDKPFSRKSTEFAYCHLLTHTDVMTLS